MSKPTSTYILAVILLVIGAGVAAYYLTGPVERQESRQDGTAAGTPASSTTAVFSCAAGQSITATFYPDDDREVDLALGDDRSLTLAHVISGSGARYANADESIVFWNKGNTAFLSENGTETYRDCVIEGEVPSTWQSTTTPTGITFRYPEDLGLQYVELIDWPPQVATSSGPFDCSEAGAVFDRAGQSEMRSVGGTEACVTQREEGAAGSVYAMYAYVWPHETEAVALTFSVRYPQCGNYPETEAAACTAETEALELDRLLGTMWSSMQFPGHSSLPVNEPTE